MSDPGVYAVGTPPSFRQTLARALEVETDGIGWVQSATAAEEVERNPRSYELLTSRLPDLGFVSHEELKRMVEGTKLVVRTGEATPYSNVILRCGVPF